MLRFRNAISGRGVAEVVAARGACALEAHVLQLHASLERKRATGAMATDVSRFVACTRFDAVQVERLGGSHMLQEQLETHVSLFHSPSSEAEPLRLRFTFALERSVSHLCEVDDFDAKLVDAQSGKTLLRLTDSNVTRGDLRSLDELVEAWCLDLPADARRDAGWFLAMVLTDPSDHAFDLLSRELVALGSCAEHMPAV
ncbi:hypothetical protein T492DRAFT_1095295 [Pavlovales sp. CCMP2436]|nr:hypothetical protein T492DRAFT_1095295 [Pavlovales sp. CCMP2436]